jgi:hypothetical protein
MYFKIMLGTFGTHLLLERQKEKWYGGDSQI